MVRKTDDRKVTEPTVPRTKSEPEPSISDTLLDAEISSLAGSGMSLLNHPKPQESTTVKYNDDISQSVDDLTKALNFLHRDDAVLIAAELGDDICLEHHIRVGANIHAMDHLGRNALHLAVCARNTRSVLLLLKAGVDPNVKDNLGMTPLSLCLMRSPSWKMANMLFDYGAIIMPRSTPMDTGLFLQFVIMCIPTEVEKKILYLLVEKGCQVNDPEAPGGRQALHFAVMSNNCKLIKILLNMGADVFTTNHRNETPKQVAVTYKCKEALLMLEKWIAHNEKLGNV